MKPACFDYFRPVVLEDIFELLERHGAEARLIAGGQSLVPMMNLRMAKPKVLIDLAAIPGLAGIVAEEDTIRIGAMTRQSDLLSDAIVRRHLALLPAAVAHVGHFQTRSRGTVGGSLAHADPSAELSLVMVTLGATLMLRSARGERLVAARDFFLDALTTAVAEGEVLTDIVVPMSPPDAKVAFRECARRHGDFALVSAAVQWSASERTVAAALGAVGTVPHFCRMIERAGLSGPLDVDRCKDLIGREIDSIDAISDLNASAGYRRHVAAGLLLECLQEVFDA